MSSFDRDLPPRSASLADSAEELLDRLERDCQKDVAPRSSERPPRLETGVALLDQTFGGFPIGTPTSIAVDRANTVGVLVAAIARRCRHSTVLATSNKVTTTQWIVAAEAGVPAALVVSGTLVGSDLDAVRHAVNRVADRPVTLTESVSRSGLRSVVEETDAAIIVVTEPERFDERVEAAVSTLQRTFEPHSVAVLVLFEGKATEADMTVVSTDRRGAHLAFLTPDPVDLIRRLDGRADPLTRRLVDT